jgi:hypothetical protein
VARDTTTIVRVHKKKTNFITIDTTFLSDDRMSWRAKGILAYLLAKPDNWQVYVSDLVKRSTEGRDSVYKVLNELIECGYVVRNQPRDSRGRLTGAEYIVYEQPIVTPQSAPLPDLPDTAAPDAVTPDMDSPDTAEPTQINNNLSNTDVTNKQQQPVVVNDRYRAVTGEAKDLSPLIARHGSDRVLQAIAYLGRYKRRKAVDNPYGFITDALRLGWDFGSPPAANYTRLEETRQYIAEMENLPRLPQEQVSEILARMREQLK